MTPRTLLQRMRDSRVISYRFTIVEGWNMRELRAALARATPLVQTIGELDDAALMEALGRPGVHRRAVPAETYVYTRGDSDLDVLRRANAALERVLEQAWAERAPDLPLASPDEALVLASIIEKETGIAEERPHPAACSSPAEAGHAAADRSDRDLRHGRELRWQHPPRRPARRHALQHLHPRRAAASADRDSGRGRDPAATQPADGDELYFVAVGSGSNRRVLAHLAEHNHAVREYVRRYPRRFGPR